MAASCGCGCAVAAPAEPTPPPMEEVIEPEYTKEYLVERVNYFVERMHYAEIMRDAAYKLGYDDNSDVVILAAKEWMAANSRRQYYQNFLNEILAEEARWERRKKEYPEATTVWMYLKDLGYNDYICAGIMGNMMAECAGNTLKLQPNIYNPTGEYYGICQWSRTYNPSIFDKGLNEQLHYLATSIEQAFYSFGKLYQRGFTYAHFLQLTDAREVALAFAKCYERCNSKHYSVRQDNAIIAYNYFTSNE